MQNLYGSYGLLRGVCVCISETSFFPNSWEVSLLSCNYLRALNRLSLHSALITQLGSHDIQCNPSFTAEVLWYHIHAEVLRFQGLTELKPEDNQKRKSIFVLWGSISAYPAIENSFPSLIPATFVKWAVLWMSMYFNVVFVYPAAALRKSWTLWSLIVVSYRVMERGMGNQIHLPQQCIHTPFLYSKSSWHV